MKQLTEYVFKHIHTVREAFEDLLRCSVGALRSAAFEHPTLHPFFGFRRRKVRQSQEVLGLIVGTLLHELLPSLVVDDASHAIGKRALIRIAGRAGSNGVALEHPTASESQHRIQSRAQGIHLGRGRGHHVGTTIGPTRQQGAILLK